MVKLLLRKLVVQVRSTGGEFGANVDFPDGLVVLRAENSAGKSTLVQSIIYVLGLEGMLSASRDVPLPHAMTDSIEEGSEKFGVIESSISLEIENHLGIRVTITRFAKGGSSRNLISLCHGPALTNPMIKESFRVEDKYVRDGGAATSETGFHKWLAEYLGWDLPIVTRYDGSECLLYLECMFPLMLVEQKKAWTGIQARMPTQYRIRDVSKRAIEFILNLSVFEALVKRQLLKTRQEQIETQWKEYTISASSAARMAGGIIQGVEKSVMKDWPGIPSIALILNREGAWVSVDEAIAQDRVEIERFKREEIPTIEASKDSIVATLRTTEEKLESVQILLSEAGESARSMKSQLSSVDTRIDELDESLAGNKSVKKLRTLGSLKALSTVEKHICPTCHQKTTDSLLLSGVGSQPMSLDDNIAYIESQRKIYKATREGLIRSITAQEAVLQSLKLDEDEFRATIRSLKSSLVTEGQALSRVAIEALVAAELSLVRNIEAKNSVSNAFENLERLTRQWSLLLDEQKKLSKDGLSEEDKIKIIRLEKLFRDHAVAFGVSSLEPSSISLSMESYKPTHEGFDLEFDLSASDLIRTIWAYLHSLLELSRSEKTNHLGLLVLDEPRQQETKRESFGQFFKRASQAGAYSQQVVVATSEDPVTLEKMLEGLPHSYVRFTGDKILKRIAID
ncbi:MAG: hypothetical protein ABI162_07480 [Luteolibacter sp.]